MTINDTEPMPLSQAPPARTRGHLSVSMRSPYARLRDITERCISTLRANGAAVLAREYQRQLDLLDEEVKWIRR